MAMTNAPFSRTHQLTFPVSGRQVSHQAHTGEPHPDIRRTEATGRLQSLLEFHRSRWGCES